MSAQRIPTLAKNSAEQPTARQAILARLSCEVRDIEATGIQSSGQAAISTGCQAMDHCLPMSGYAPGSVIEYVRATSGCGACYLALTAAAAALQAAEDKFLVIVDSHQQIYPPALLSHQIPLHQVVWVRPGSQTDSVWAIDQALRTTAVAVVLADIEMLDERDARRLQLAAQRGGGLGLLLRGLSARRMPSWAEVQWVVRSLLPTPNSTTSHQTGVGLPSTAHLPQSETHRAMRRLEVQLARLRGGKAGARLLLDVDARRGGLQLVERQRNRYERNTKQTTASLRPTMHLPASPRTASA